MRISRKFAAFDDDIAMAIHVFSGKDAIVSPCDWCVDGDCWPAIFITDEKTKYKTSIIFHDRQAFDEFTSLLNEMATRFDKPAGK